MNPVAAKSFAEWLAHDQPELFVALYKKALPMEVQRGLSGLSGFTDILSSIGTGLSSAVSSVGSFLSSPAGLTTVGTLGATYLQSQAAKQAVNVNLARAQSGVQAAPIQTVYNPSTRQYEAQLVQPTGQSIQLTPSIMRSIAPGMPTWAPWAIGGVALIALLLFLRR